VRPLGRPLAVNYPYGAAHVPICVEPARELSGVAAGIVRDRTSDGSPLGSAGTGSRH
jgi:hypothetical protein